MEDFRAEKSCASTKNHDEGTVWLSQRKEKDTDNVEAKTNYGCTEERIDCLIYDPGATEISIEVELSDEPSKSELTLNYKTLYVENERLRLEAELMKKEVEVTKSEGKQATGKAIAALSAFRDFTRKEIEAVKGNSEGIAFVSIRPETQIPERHCTQSLDSITHEVEQLLTELQKVKAEVAIEAARKAELTEKVDGNVSLNLPMANTYENTRMHSAGKTSSRTQTGLSLFEPGKLNKDEPNYHQIIDVNNNDDFFGSFESLKSSHLFHSETGMNNTDEILNISRMTEASTCLDTYRQESERTGPNKRSESKQQNAIQKSALPIITRTDGCHGDQDQYLETNFLIGLPPNLEDSALFKGAAVCNPMSLKGNLENDSLKNYKSTVSVKQSRDEIISIAGTNFVGDKSYRSHDVGDGSMSDDDNNQLKQIETSIYHDDDISNISRESKTSTSAHTCVEQDELMDINKMLGGIQPPETNPSFEMDSFVDSVYNLEGSNRTPVSTIERLEYETLENQILSSEKNNIDLSVSNHLEQDLMAIEKFDLKESANGEQKLSGIANLEREIKDMEKSALQTKHPFC